MSNHKLVLGFAHWGDKEVTIQEMIELVKFAIENGIEEIDCAPHYGDGAQENVLAAALLALPKVLRDRVKISTKVGRVIDPDQKSESSNGFTNSSGFLQSFNYSKEGIETSFRQSQLRMCVPTVHALYLHDIDENTHRDNHKMHYQTFLKDGYLGFDNLKAKKKIAVTGIGSNDARVCVDLIKDGRFNIDRIMLAGCYNLLNFTLLDELLPLCKKRNIELYIAAPYGGGLLSDQPGNNFFRYEKANENLLNKVAKIKEICAEYNVGLPHAAMQFVHMNPDVKRVVVGARTKEELSTSLKYANTPINPKFWEELKEANLIPKTTLIPPLKQQMIIPSIFTEKGVKQSEKLEAAQVELNF
ncbi:aldo/keto reductase [Legionella hackeliae]|uniref:Putative Pyridoxal 4-dehydrogenase n=1 Tax=Legionella hackeliae TaxID=449 RepID=A0A0A8UTA0_LEGHA|nr:aldo/keto reductase [Legionella hackeliae]KTD12654.1 aldo/keto reductase [Legionella hackeliae]CEK12070.1 putative Pyridoxal 4-dehydrogenase [Legionella hackeliae]STX48858.1 aldo/keto reductase [Legionella hackeliae]